MSPTSSAFLFLSTCLLLTACSSNEIGRSKDVNQQTIYQQYTINYNEGEENVTVNAQFRFAGEEGTTLVLTEPGLVSFDGVPLPVDSTDWQGAYYRKEVSIKNFFGRHYFIYTDIDQKAYRNNFRFDTFRLADIPTAASKKEALQIPFDMSLLGPDDYVEISSVDADSSFTLSFSAADKKGIIIPLENMQKQNAAMLKIAPTLYRKLPLESNTKEGGIIQMAYSLQPIEIKLVD